MTTRADELIDRRRLRRKLSFWRILALVAAAAGWILQGALDRLRNG